MVLTKQVVLTRKGKKKVRVKNFPLESQQLYKKPSVAKFVGTVAKSVGLPASKMFPTYG